MSKNRATTCPVDNFLVESHSSAKALKEQIHMYAIIKDSQTRVMKLVRDEIEKTYCKLNRTDSMADASSSALTAAETATCLCDETS